MKAILNRSSIRLVALLALAALLAAYVGNAATAKSSTAGNLGQCIDAGQYIHAYEYLQPSTSSYKLIMNPDGNLVLYASDGKTPLWDAQTGGNPGAYAELQASDGNLVVYSVDRRALWSAYVGPAPGDKLCVGSTGNLVVYSSSNAPLWATNTVIPAPVGGAPLSYNPGALGNCTWYAEDMFHRYSLGGAYINTTYVPGKTPSGDAMYWATNAASRGWAVGSTPRIDSIAVFQRDVAGAGYVGHVAWVTAVYPSQNKITITEMHFPNYGVIDTRTISPAYGVTGLQYIYVNP